ncbi:unnamed protein product [Pleuronectes platessa]|uniref:Uncharacterized protein n=1 Tax=Pleuronectes platessa TaxID=8262 RepID=A0A9N7YPF8_PLEPL|nr:unnamed protein product [Pleuronectes platessa]
MRTRIRTRGGDAGAAEYIRASKMPLIGHSCTLLPALSSTSPPLIAPQRAFDPPQLRLTCRPHSGFPTARLGTSVGSLSVRFGRGGFPQQKFVKEECRCAQDAPRRTEQ